MYTDADHRFMSRALELAAKAMVHATPNPRVGCVVVREGRIIGEGFTQRPGSNHAEVEALLDARRSGHDLHGAQVYVTLEPCAHFGRTPPCATALIEAIDGLAAGTLKPRPQPADGANYAPKIDKSEAALDWSASALQLDRQVRAFNPWPVAETRFAGETLRVLRAQVAAPAGSEAAPGTLLGIADDGLRVACGTGVLAVRELQRAGKRPIAARDFANAVRLAGLRFGA